jgi:hypothetical protein
VRARTSNLWPLPVALLVLAASVWMYWPGIHGPTLLDDRSNVGVISSLQEQPDAAADYIFGNRSGPLGRPVAMYSFVLEELYQRDSSADRKGVNILLHALNGALVMWLFSLLFAHARLPAHRWFALLAATAWLVTPLYVSTVLYVVQRMAILSTTFMLLACIVYCYWRQVLFRRLLGVMGGVLLLACVALAALSKENGILVIAIIVLLEVLWFGGRNADGTVDGVLRRASLVLLCLGCAGALLGLLLGMESILKGYSHRDFTLTERLLTQARILWDYVGQLLWPDLPSLGVFHDDYQLSTGLFTPRVTAVAVFAWLLLLPVCLLAVRRPTGRLLVCAVLVYLVPHTIESSVFALELYFEHRNYFPGIGVFLFLAAGLASLGKRWPPLVAPILAWCAVYVLLLALQTGSQVQIWSSAPLLRLNHVNQHPNSFRANEEMALHLAGVGALDSALAYSRRASEVSTQERPGDRQIRDIALYCLAGREVPVDLIAALGTINPQRPFAVVSTMQGFAKILQREVCARSDRIAFADRMAEVFLGDASVATASPKYYLVLAGIENDLGRYDNAYAYTEKLLESSPSNVRGMLMQLHFATALGNEQQAQILVQQLLQLQEEGRLKIGDRKTLALYL